MSPPQPQDLELYYEDAHPLFRAFIVPLMRGDQVTIDRPVDADTYDALLTDLLTASRYYDMLQIELQQRADHILPDPPNIELTPDDAQLLVAAYQCCWFFHSSVEEGDIWERRQKNVLEVTRALLDRIEPPTRASQILARHLLLRHLPRVSRTDYHLNFGYFWSDLRFYGTKPKWLKLPGRSNPVIERTNVSVADQANDRPVAELYYRTLSLSPLTSILSCDRIYPHFTFHTSLHTLASPGLCRFVTNALLVNGLENFMPSLFRGFLTTLNDTTLPRPTRRYFARFLYNLTLTHCRFATLQELQTPTRYGAELFSHTPAQAPSETSQSYQAAIHEKERKQHIHNDGQRFHALFKALHILRGPMGAARLFAHDEALTERVRTFVNATPIDDTHLSEIRKLLREQLGWDHS